MKSRSNTDVGAMMDGTRRAMKAAYQRELDYLESPHSWQRSAR